MNQRKANRTKAPPPFNTPRSRPSRSHRTSQTINPATPILTQRRPAAEPPGSITPLEDLIDAIATHAHTTDQAEQFAQRYTSEPGFKRLVRQREQLYCSQNRVLQSYRLLCWRGYLEHGDPLAAFPEIFKSSATRYYRIKSYSVSAEQQAIDEEVERMTSMFDRMAGVLYGYVRRGSAEEGDDDTSGTQR